MIRCIKITILLALIIALVSCNSSSTPQNFITNTPSPEPLLPVQTSPPGTLRFVVMADSRGSDNGINTEIIEKTLNSIKNIEPQPLFAIMPGDLINGSGSYTKEKNQLMHFKETITKYYPINFFYPGFGNHEGTAGKQGEKAFSEVFTEFNANFLDGYNKTVYFFDKNNTRFYMLNSNHPGEGHAISDVQLNWVKANSDEQKRHNIYFFHEPAWPTGAHMGSSLDVNKLQRDKLWEVVDNSAGPLVFCGHEHNYSRRHINSDFNEIVKGQSFDFKKTVYQITAGSFGAPLYKGYSDSKDVDVPPVIEYHYAIVDVTADNILVTVYTTDGKVIDRCLSPSY